MDHTPLGGFHRFDDSSTLATWLDDAGYRTGLIGKYMNEYDAEDASYVLERTRGVVGFFGASSRERLPTEVALTETVARFKAIATTPREGERV